MLTDALSDALTLRLFKNDYTPVAASVAGDFTEADFGGYAEKPLAANDWSAPATNAEGKAESEQPEQSWTNTSAVPQTVYGVYVVDGDGNVRWAERFASPQSIEQNSEIHFTPKFRLFSA